MLDNATGGMSNENQVQMFYNLMATHPNEVSLSSYITHNSSRKYSKYSD